MLKKYNNILGTIGETPVVRINKLAPAGINLYVKVEAFNPMGSIKDRLALGIIEDAERRGTLTPGQTVIEATSGNTGIGLAMVCAQKGYPLVVTMAENFSVERRRLIRFLGAKVVLTPAAQKGSGMLAKAEELAEKHGWFLCRQFENEANADAHAKTTAPEILRAFENETLDYWVTGAGTGGTLKGVAKVLKRERPDLKVVACEPDNAPILGSGITQQRDQSGSPIDSHPSFRPHVMQGWTPDFISKLSEDALSSAYVDEIRPIKGDDALRLSRELARQEGIFTGITGGATLAGALQICETVPPGTTILCMLPDTGERYLSTPLFDDIQAEMSEEEINISRSTSGYRFDIQAVPVTPEPEINSKMAGEVAPDAVAETTSQTAPKIVSVNKVSPTSKAGDPGVKNEVAEFIEDTISDPDNPVVMFALEWCEFCWSVRKLFKEYDIPYRTINLDSTDYQKDDLGGKIRGVLSAKTGCTTIPQIFIAGQFIGGCTELFDAIKSGQVHQMLAGADVSYATHINVEPTSFLPTWLHPR
jgi:cysteine synthase